MTLLLFVRIVAIYRINVYFNLKNFTKAQLTRNLKSSIQAMLLQNLRPIERFRQGVCSYPRDFSIGVLGCYFVNTKVAKPRFMQEL